MWFFHVSNRLTLEYLTGATFPRARWINNWQTKNESPRRWKTAISLMWSINAWLVQKRTDALEIDIIHETDHAFTQFQTQASDIQHISKFFISWKKKQVSWTNGRLHNRFMKWEKKVPRRIKRRHNSWNTTTQGMIFRRRAECQKTKSTKVKKMRFQPGISLNQSINRSDESQVVNQSINRSL